MKYDLELIGQINAFEQLTKVKVKEVFLFKEKLTFMVHPGKLWKALGKDKANLKKLERVFNKHIRIIEFSEDMVQFIKNLIAPLKCSTIVDENNIVTITGPDAKTKGLMIGSKAKNLRETETIVQKHFPDLKEIKVV